jgi:hypothetical protein
MSCGIEINNKKYICLHNDNNLKHLSLEDNVYFTLRDIFSNGDTYDTIIHANNFNEKLTNDIRYEDRTPDFKYTNKLNEYGYVKLLKNWLNYIKKYHFDFYSFDNKERKCKREIIFGTLKYNYMDFEVWWNQFNDLRRQVNERFAYLESKESESESVSENKYIL